MAWGKVSAQTTLDFANDYQTLFPTITGVSDNDNHDGDFVEATTSAAVDGITVTVSPSGVSNANRLWYTASGRLRMYGGTFTVTSANGNITRIDFNGAKWNAKNTVNTGEITVDGNKATWEGSASSIVLTVAANTQLNSIVVYLEGQEPVDISNTPETAYTVAEAKELITAGEGLDAEVYVKGIVTEIQEIETENHGNATYYINDTESTEGQLMVYRGYYYKGQKFTTGEEIKVGDEVIVYGQLMQFYETQEIGTGSEIYSINGVTAPEVDITNTPETAYTVAEAKELITAGEGLDAEVYVKGIVTEIQEIETENHGNATYYINDTESTEGQLMVYRGYYLNGDKFTSQDQLKVGDEVIVYGQLVQFYETQEIGTGSEIYSINGVTSGINAPTVEELDENAPVYNLAGQRVSKGTKGILIQNGKKFINK